MVEVVDPPPPQAEINATRNMLAHKRGGDEEIGMSCGDPLRGLKDSIPPVTKPGEGAISRLFADRVPRESRAAEGKPCGIRFAFGASRDAASYKADAARPQSKPRVTALRKLFALRARLDKPWIESAIARATVGPRVSRRCL